MTLSIPKTGSASVNLSNGSLVLWYQRSIRFWTLQQLNKAGDQIGPNNMGHGCGGSEASYHHHREDAVAEMEEIVARDVVTLDADGLSGDAPGAAPVTIEVDGRKLVLPRALMSSVLTFAYNRGCEKADVEKDDLGRAWLVNFVEDINKLSRFVASR